MSEISYKKLWKLLIDKGLNKTQLREKAGISSATLAKISKNQNVNTESLIKICNSLSCRIEDIMEIVRSTDEDE